MIAGERAAVGVSVAEREVEDRVDVRVELLDGVVVLLDRCLELDDGAVADLVERFHRPVLAELARRGIEFRGALFAGLMLTADGPRLLEFNVRFGDPETQVQLPRLATPLGPLLAAAARDRLAFAAQGAGIRRAIVPTIPGAAVGVVVAAPGYPSDVSTGGRIEGIAEARDAGALVFVAGVASVPLFAWLASTMRRAGSLAFSSRLLTPATLSAS